MTGELIAGRYRMQKRLGAGGMATVFLAKDERLERDVAIKRLHADSDGDVGIRFQREAKVGASLNHPNIVAVYDTVADDEGVLIVMEYVPGHTLRDEIARGPIDPARAIEVLCAVASALDNAHEHGVVHRDIKPANVLVDDRAGQVKLADLGIATAAEHSRITQSGAVLGTAAYMAPERLDGGSGDKGVDIYSLAAMAFEMLSGRKAIEGSSPLEIARRVATAPPRDLREVVSDAPDGAAEALKRGLAKRPEDRQGSAGELVRELSGAYAAQAEARAARPAPAPEPQRAPAPVPAPIQTSTGNGHGNGRAAVVGATGEAHRPSSPRPYTPAGTGRRWAIPAAIALAALLILGVLVATLASGGGGSDKPASKSSASGKKKSSSQAKSQGGSSSSAAPAPATAAPSGGTATPTDDGSTPTGAVSSFYKGSIDDPQGSYRKYASDRLKGQIGEADFVNQESTLKSIDFPMLKVTDQTADTATVQFRSIARHTTKTDRCRGTITVVKGTNGWLVDQLGVNCTHGPPS